MRRPTDDLLRRLELGLWPVRRPNPVLGLWRWRHECGGLALLGVAVWAAAHLPVVLTVVALVGVAAAGAVPPFRRAVATRARGVVVQHRLRSAFRGARLYTPRGRLPALLWTTPRPAAVRVLVWLPAGLAVEDLQDQESVLATACFAEHAEVIAREHRHLVYIVLVYDPPPLEPHPGVPG